MLIWKSLKFQYIKLIELLKLTVFLNIEQPWSTQDSTFIAYKINVANVTVP